MNSQIRFNLILNFLSFHIIGSYPPRPQYPPSSYAPTPPLPANQPTSANNMPPGGPQYPGRAMPNHSGGPGAHSQFPQYQNWVPPSPQGHGAGVGGGGVTGGPAAGAPPVVGGMGNHIQGKGTPPPGGPPPQGGGGGGGGSPRPLNYLKQHLQHKGGGGGGYSPTPPQGYGNGPGMHPGMPMGPPPHHMGPPHGPTNMGPPTSTPPQGSGIVLGSAGGLPPGSGEVGLVPQPPDHISQDNGISSSGSSTASGPHLVTSVVTTGPDGTPMDDVSQQSTLSNASAGKKKINEKYI